MTRHKVAVVGCGGVSRMHFRGLAAHGDRAELVAACDPDAQRLAAAGKEFGVGRPFASLDEMIRGAEWDVAVVCTPTPVRLDVVSALAAAGKHVLVEKPMADSLDEARRMVEVCASAGVELAVNQNFRYHYPFDIARGLIDRGAIGQVASVLLVDLMWRQDAGWRTRCKRHALSVMGVHWLDGLRWMLGEEAASLRCRMSSSDAIDCRGETDASVQIAFESGTFASCVESFSTRLWKNETLVIGTRATLMMSYASAALYEAAPPGEPKETFENPYGGRAKPESAFRALDELLTAIDEGRSPSNSGADNLKTIALLEGAYRSAETGRAVEFREGMLQ